MLRLTLMLGTAIYAGLIVFSNRVADAPGPGPATAIEVGRTALAVDVASPAAQPAGDTVLVTADGRRLAIAAVIDPSRTGRSEEIARVTTRSAEDAVSVSASGGVAERPIVEVTGNQVNLRAGPSTDTAVLGSLVRGDRAELIGADAGNGWVLIRAIATGTEGYMADRFVALVN